MKVFIESKVKQFRGYNTQINKDKDRKEKGYKIQSYTKRLKTKGQIQKQNWLHPKQVKTCIGSETKTKKKERTKCKETNKKMLQDTRCTQRKIKAFDKHKVRVTLYTKVVGQPHEGAPIVGAPWRLNHLFKCFIWLIK